MQYKLILFDIDGVLTDGKVIINQYGEESKIINYNDIDAIHAFSRKKIKIGALTKEETPIVNFFKQRFPWNYFFSGVACKLDIIKQIINIEKINSKEVIYVGDSKNDSESLSYVGLGVCPKNATKEAKKHASLILKSSGGDGVVHELLEYLSVGE